MPIIAFARGERAYMNYNRGKNLEYFWIELNSREFDLIALVKEIPDLIIGKYVAIVCNDGGAFIPTEEERLRGWYQKGEISFSPIMTSDELKEGVFEDYDQWCMFEKKAEFDKMTDYVNYGGFTLIDRNNELEEIHPTWDKVGLKKDVEKTESLKREFWNEVENINPNCIVVNGDNFIFCSKDVKEIEKIIASVKLE